jgi:hypothetical protein
MVHDHDYQKIQGTCSNICPLFLFFLGKKIKNLPDDLLVLFELFHENFQFFDFSKIIRLKN